VSDPCHDGRLGRFVARDERERLLVAFAEVVWANGFEAAGADAVARRAGVGVEAVRREFATKDACLAAARASAAEQAFAAAARAYERTAAPPRRRGWAEGIRAGLAEMLGFLAYTPQFTQLYDTRAIAAGPHAQPALDRAADWFARCLRDAPAGAADHAGRGAVTAEATAGAVLEAIRGYASREGIDALPGALPTVTLLALSPYVGAAEAARIAAQAHAGA
jgi:AcrR family transcriptional regulator